MHNSWKKVLMGLEILISGVKQPREHFIKLLKYEF